MLLLLINLMSYLDRYVLAAVEPDIRRAFFGNGHGGMGKTGLLATAFLVSYMVTAPIFGWLADRFSRWILIAISVGIWSLASAGTGLALTFGMMLMTRVFVGIGEAGYGPAAPTIISDLYPIEVRGRVLSWFFMAIPVGSALGYVFGGIVSAHLGWRWPFYLVAPPGILLALYCLWQRDPRAARPAVARAPTRLADYTRLLQTPSLVLNTLAQAAMTFAIGGISFWIPAYIHDFRKIDNLPQINTIFGGITVVAGLCATIWGGWLGDRLRPRFPGSYFLVSGCGMLIAFPLSILMLYTPFPAAWVVIFFAVFFLFMNIGPSNTALANVAVPSMRATAFALNIFVIHALGDAISPPVIGAVADRYDLNRGFLVVSGAMLVAGVLWLAGIKYLARDTARAEEAA